MSATDTAQESNGWGLSSPVRNRYFYGKLLDTYHFELETDYLNRKRWLINRLVNGWGVVCGLNVVSAPRHEHIIVEPGVAIDKCGRELIVPCSTRPIPIPSEVVEEASEREYGDRCQWQEEPATIHVLICYHECLTEPVPVMTSECNGDDRCSPGAIKERYEIIFRPGPAPRVPTECHEYDFPDVISGRTLDYDMLARWVTSGCPEVPSDCCIPLADIHVWGDEKPGCAAEDIDITVRPIVYTNDLLFLLLLSLLEERSGRRTK